MKQHLNTLFVVQDDAWLVKDGEAVAVRVEQETRLRVPFINLGSIACFGRVNCTTPLMAACAQLGIGLAFLSRFGRFQAVVHGYSPGNVLLRRAQYRIADDETASASIAAACVMGKVANCRAVLRRAARESNQTETTTELTHAADRLDDLLQRITGEHSLDQIRGLEGEGSATYFAVFNQLLGNRDPAFQFTTRSRRPPLDPINALLSFLYTLLAGDARSACEAAGLDAAVGFLHRDRPGRPSLALDLMEELRPILADRLALSLINRKQVRASGFRVEPTGGVVMDDDTRKKVLVAYQKRKQEEVMHPFLRERVSLGLIVHLQARLLARRLRGELDAYPACIWK